MNRIYQATIQKELFTIDLNNQKINENNFVATFQKKEHGTYQFIINNQSIIADIVKIDYDLKQLWLRIEGKKYAIALKEPVDLQLEKLGINTLQPKKVNHLKAPMPGLVLKVLVHEGQTVKAGETLLILEAMKMENVFKATADAVIKTIKISEKQAVEKGQELITFE